MTVQGVVLDQAASQSRTIVNARNVDVPALTGLRFVAALSVLVAHGVSTILASHETPLGAVYWLRQASGFGMTLFFVLSGFVIHCNYANVVTDGGPRGVAAYLWARFARLYPLFLLMLLVNILVSSRHLDFWAGHPERLGSTLRALPYFLMSIQSWVYVPIEGNALISAIGGGSPLTWSISTEWFFYFVYPFIAWLILRARRPSITAGVVVLWCLVWIGLATAIYDRSPQIDAWAIERFGSVAGAQDHQQDLFVRWLLYMSPYLRIGEFGLGALIAQLYVLLRPRPATELESRIANAVLIAAGASVFLITYLMYSPTVGQNIFRKMNMNFALAPACALIIFCAARYASAISAALTSRTAILMGDASYSIYLVHYVAFTTVVALTGRAAHSVALDVATLVAVTAAIFAISVTLFAYFEDPCRRWLRRQWGARGRVIALAAAPAGLATVIVAVRQLL